MDLLERFDIPQMTKRYRAKLAQMRVSETRTFEKSRTLVENQTETVARRQAGLQAQRDKLELYQVQLIKTEMRAPQDGLVIFARSSSRYSESYIKLGADIRKGYNVIDLPDVSELMAVVQVHESYVRHLRNGLKAIVKIDSLPEQEFKGVVRLVAPTPDQRRRYYENISVYDTHVWIEDEHNQLPKDLKPGGFRARRDRDRRAGKCTQDSRAVRHHPARPKGGAGKARRRSGNRARGNGSIQRPLHRNPRGPCRGRSSFAVTPNR